MNFYSHRWCEDNNIKHRLLKKHLIEVGRRAYESLHNLDFEGDNELLYKSAVIIGCLHDFGKYTSYFQDYLANQNSKYKHSKYKEHAFISALYASYCAIKNSMPNEYVLYIYLSIKHHHGNLCNMDSDIGTSSEEYIMPSAINKNLSISKKQVEDLKKNENFKKDIEDVFEFVKDYNISIDYLDDFFSEDLNEIFNKLINIYKQIKYGKNGNASIIFSDLLLLYSSLIDNDKRNAASISDYHRKCINSCLVDEYKEKNLNNKIKINSIRNDLYNSVKSSLNNINLRDHFFSITSPTGTGKTIAGIYAALSIRNKIFSNSKKMYRIIYGLPFTTIVDQNYSVCKRILSLNPDFSKNEERYIIKHHHLSLLTAKIDNEELPLDESLMLIEDWDSEIIFTTFVELFSSLAGYKNKDLKKYFRIANSIIILDEIQSIGVEKWPEIEYLMDYYAKKFNVYFILMSATMSKLIDESKRKELGGDFKKRFDCLDRVSIHIDMEKLTAEKIIEKYINIEANSKLFVFNTIKTSIIAYNYLKQQINDDYQIYYLSSNIVPIRKREILNKILLDIKNNKKIIVVATQIFEAGVDISFNVVIRDIAPIDSLIQSSGRVNRNALDSNGNMFVVNCISENKPEVSGYYCRLVYGNIHTDISLGILENRSIINETDYLSIINEYYRKIANSSEGSAERLKKALNSLDFNANNNDYDHYYVSNFSIIDNLNEYISVFVELNDDAKKIIDDYNGYYKNRKSYDRGYFINLKRKMYDYIISAKKRDIEKLCHEKKYDDFYIIRRDYLSSSYSDETGLKDVSNDAIIV